MKEELGIEGWSYSTVKAYLSVLNNCDREVIDAIFAGEFDATRARQFTKFSPEQQRELIALWREGKEAEYNKRLKEIEKAVNPDKAVLYTHRDATKKTEEIAKKLIRDKKEIQKMISFGLPKTDERVLSELVLALEQLEKTVQKASTAMQQK